MTPARRREAADERQTVRVGHRTLSVSNLDKVLYPAAGTTKADLIRYHVAVAEVELPHVAGRPATFVRHPDGVEAAGFFEKRCPDHRPDWVETVALPKRGEGGDPDDRLDHCSLDEVGALVWAANLAVLEVHVPMGRAPDPLRPTAVVFDLDPGEPADVLDCARVALRLRDVFDRLGLASCAKTSGGKGLQVYVPTGTAATYEGTRGFAHAVGLLLERDTPEKIVTVQTKSVRPGKVLIDWTQNHPIKTTIGAYSPRAAPRPTVSTPLTWDEVSDGLDGDDPAALSFELGDVIDRVVRQGDLFAPVAQLTQELPALTPPPGPSST